MQLRGARDRNNPRLLGEQPGERDLSRCRLLPFGDAAEQIDQGLIRLERLRREAWQGAAEVGAVEGRVLVDLAREEALAQRAVRDEADPQLLKGRQPRLPQSCKRPPSGPSAKGSGLILYTTRTSSASTSTRLTNARRIARRVVQSGAWSPSCTRWA